MVGRNGLQWARFNQPLHWFFSIHPHTTLSGSFRWNDLLLDCTEMQLYMLISLLDVIYEQSKLSEW